jgi:hypothetical protein
MWISSPGNRSRKPLECKQRSFYGSSSCLSTGSVLYNSIRGIASGRQAIFQRLGSKHFWQSAMRRLRAVLVYLGLPMSQDTYWLGVGKIRRTLGIRTGSRSTSRRNDWSFRLGH